MAKQIFRLTEAEVLKIMQDVVDEILIPKFMELGMNASGKWIDSLSVEYDGEKVAKIRGQSYTQFLTKGRNPNANQDPEALKKWAAWAANTFIKKWLDDKGLAASPYAVAMSIAKKGTSWKRRGGSDLLEILNSPETINFIKKRVTSAVIPKIAEQMRRNAIESLNR